MFRAVFTLFIKISFLKRHLMYLSFHLDFDSIEHSTVFIFY